MKTRNFNRILAGLLSAVMLVGILPIAAFAAWKDDNAVLSGDKFGTNGYYNVISKKDYVLVPGAAVESDIVLNNASGTRRQEVHVMEIDPSNPDISIIPGYYGIDKFDPDDKSTWHAKQLSETIKYYEDTFGYNVVGGMNTDLCYENDSAKGFLVFNHQVLATPENDNHGEIPYYIAFYEKEGGGVYCETRQAGTPLRGDELHAVATSSFGFYVKDGALCRTTEDRTGVSHPRSVVGIKEDGTLVMMMVNGRMVSSSGLTDYEIGEFMLSLGCKWALNCDGGGSSTFVTKRQGETELTMRSIPSDGAERATIHSLLIVSNVAPTGELGSVEIESEYEAFSPYSSYTFTANALDTHGYAMDMPEGATWGLSDETFGTIENGTFVSNGKLGEVDIQVSFEGNVVGGYTIKVMHPFVSAVNPNIVVPYGKYTDIGLRSMMSDLEGEEKAVYITANDYEFTITPAEAGHMEGFNFVASAETTVTCAALTATYKYGDRTTVNFTVTLGKGSEILWDFEDATQLDEFTTSAIGWKTKDTPEISLATAENGKVHDGKGALRFEIDATHLGQPVTQSMRFQVMPKKRVVIEGAKSVGAWVYIPNELWTPRVRLILREVNEDGSLSGAKLYYTMNDATVWYNHIEEGGNEGKWIYFKADIDASKKYVLGNYADLADNLAFFDFQWHTKIPNNNISTMFNAGTVNGVYNIYIDSIQVDYSDAVADREAPMITDMVYLGAEESVIPLTKNILNTVECEMLVIESNILNLRATIREDTSKANYTGIDYASAKILVDGVETPVKAVGEYLTLENYAVANGMHRITFVVSDKQGNETRKTRWINVVGSEVFESTIKMVPADPDLDKLLNGSVYWVNLNATRIETIQSVTVVIDKNSVNHWDLEHMMVAEGFTAVWSVDQYEETATITITRTGENTQIDDATLAQLPIRIIDWEDIYNDYLVEEGLGTPEGFKAGRDDDNDFAWPHDLKLEILRGEIEFVEGYSSNVANTFSSEYFRVNTIWYSHPDTIYAADPNYEWLHIHVETPVSDVKATCTSDGFEGRTHCEVCKSIVDYGTTVPAKGHDYQLTDGQFVCATCHGIYHAGTGIFEMNGKNYYAIGGKLLNGWQKIDDAWYYFDTQTFAGAEGHTKISEVTFEFEGGKLLSGVWIKTLVGNRYYYGPGYYNDRGSWRNIDGKDYFFSGGVALDNGYQLLYENQINLNWYYFNADGTCDKSYKVPDGFYTDRNGYAYCKDGKGLSGMHEIDGKYYYFNYKGYAEKNGKFAGRLFMDDYAAFTGVLEKDGVLYLYKDGITVRPGLYEVDGSYYNATWGGVVRIGEYYADSTYCDLPIGTYISGADGKLINGIYEIDGVKRLFSNGQIAKEGLYQIDGEYYVSNWHGEIRTNGTYFVSYSYCDLPANQNYTFGADGKMYNGVEEIDGALYLYINGTTATYGLYKIDGEYYYSYWGGVLKTSGRYYVGTTYCDLPANQNYTFGADGKMYNGVEEIDGILYLYINGTPATYGLYKIDGEYYYSYWSGVLKTDGRYYIDTTRCDLPANQNYTFGSDGKMLNGFVTKDDGIYYYVNGSTPMPRILYVDGYYYYVNWGGKLVTNSTCYVPADGVYADISMTYRFDEYGRLVK